MAFRNVLWQLACSEFGGGRGGHSHARGDTDTNAAICGALLGAEYGWNDVPGQNGFNTCSNAALQRESRMCAIPGSSVFGQWTHSSWRSGYSRSTSGYVGEPGEVISILIGSEK